MGHRSFVIKLYHLHKHLKLLLLFCIFSCTVFALDSDQSALLEFKSSVSDPSGALSSWSSGNSHHCSWVGVSCDSGSRVVALNITGGGNSGSFYCGKNKTAKFPLYGFGIRRACLNTTVKLVGKLSSAIAKLTQLRILSLPFNEFSGEIPVGIMGMENLEVLDLEGNLITGSIPEIKGLKNLRVLNLAFNKIIGSIPNSLSACLGLQVLNLAGNQLNGSIPDFVGRFGDLRAIYLSFNLLTGSIPVEIGQNCGSLEHLELAGNFLQDGIPKSLGNCRQLKSLLLYSNILEEGIPAELGQLNRLQVLDVSRNSLSGRIPPELGNCTELSVLVLSNLWDPSLAGDVKLGSSTEEYNFYDGTIPAEVTNISSLQMIWAPRATLEGKLPGSWGACENLAMVNFGQNYFMGEIGEVFRRCEKLNFLDLSFNRLTGRLPEDLRVPCMTVFDVSGNLLLGSIPGFSNDTCTPAYANGDLIELHEVSSVYLLLFARRAAASLLSEDDDIGLAVVHNFGGNNFTGRLPSLPVAPEMLGRGTVYAFLAGSNGLNGSFPETVFEKCRQVKIMIVNVSDNGFLGQIPADIGSSCVSLKLLDASRNQIAGTIPPSVGNLVSLVSLDLSWNMLRGPIPGNFGLLNDLRYLSLAGNNLSGYVPTSLGQLRSLRSLDLSSNSLSGAIPDDFVNLRNLTSLLLNNNDLSGQIPTGFANMTTLTAFNVSYNNLSGPLPPNNYLRKCNSVLGNPFLQSCNIISRSSPSSDWQGIARGSPDPGASPSESSNKSGGLTSIEIASITSTAAIFSVLLALIVLFVYTRKWSPRSRVAGSTRKEVTVFNEIGVPVTFESVVQATENFNAGNCIGNGGFGATYKAEIAPGVLVAVKRLAVGRFQGFLQFDAEIKTLGRLRHPNLVTLIGYHASETEMFLIYNYLPGGNLEKFIQDRSTRAVDWRILHKIALDIARALAYLHDQCVPRVLHRDVKPSNILLDEDYNAYLSDFGLARLLGTSETHATTGPAGTFGYVAPEYAMTCRVSDKADVYSYGVVLLELLSDKKALDPSFSSFGHGFNIVAWACMLLRQGRAKEFFTAGLWDSGPHDDLVELLHLAVVCTVETLSTRPTMKQVVRRLKQLQPPSC